MVEKSGCAIIFTIISNNKHKIYTKKENHMRKFTSALLCIAIAAFSQNIVKDGGFDSEDNWSALDANGIP
jgi:hypothetical protein